MTIRAAEDKDFADITRIYGHYVLHSTATFELDPPDRETMLKRRADIFAAGLPYLVAEQQGNVIGYAYAGMYRPRPAYRFTIEDSIYLDPAHTGQGAGRILLNALIDSCSRGASKQMIAVIGDSANARSIRLHEYFGFRRVGVFVAVGFKFDKWVDTVLMQKSLDS